MEKKDIKFLKSDTRTSCVVSSVIFAISVIVLIMLALLLQIGMDEKALTVFAASACLVLIANIWFGSLQIKVFKDYKSQSKALCAEGIFNICLTVLVVIAALLWVTLQSKGNFQSIDLRWFIGTFVLAFFVWKIYTVKLSIQQKRKNLWIEVLLGLLWLVLAVLVIVSIFVSSTAFFWGFMAVDTVMIVAYVVYILFTYIFNTPTYLETEEGMVLLQQEQIDRQNRLSRLNSMMGGGYVDMPQQVQQPVRTTANKVDDLETKLTKLANLKEKGIITQEEYETKRKEIINSSL